MFIICLCIFYCPFLTGATDLCFLVYFLPINMSSVKLKLKLRITRALSLNVFYIILSANQF